MISIWIELYLITYGVLFGCWIYEMGEWFDKSKKGFKIFDDELKRPITRATIYLALEILMCIVRRMFLPW